MDVSRHLFFTAASDIDKICQPLKHLGIYHFAYFKTFPDKSHVRLSNQPEWTKYYYHRRFYNLVSEQVPADNGFIPWSCLERKPVFHEASEKFNIDHGVVLIETNEHYIERYFFASTKTNPVREAFYCTNRALFYRFSMYFKDKAAELIQQADQARIQLHPITHSRFHVEDNIQAFLHSTKIKRFSVTIDGVEFYVPRREAEIIAMLKNGFTAKEMAKRLNISYRTVEFYRTNLNKRLAKVSELEPLKAVLKCKSIHMGLF